MTAQQRLTLTRADARRLLVRYHVPPAPLATIVRRLGTIQFDPLAPVGTNPDLVLQARVPGYRRGDWLRAAYEQRLLVDGWDKQASLIQPGEWWAQAPFHRWFARRWRKHGVDVDAPEARALVEQVARHGPATSLELGDQRSDPALRGSWYGPKRSRHLLKALWDTGHLMTHHRVGGRHAYDLPERVLPREAREVDATPDDALQRLVVRRVQAAGLLRPSADAAVWMLPCPRAERDRRAARAMAHGELIELDVEGTRYWATPAALSALDAAPVPAGGGAVRFLAPLDPLMWDRGGVARLFGFDYVWEVYKPQAQRRWGYYVLPVLWGERFVARFDARCQQGVLTLLAWHWEAEIHPARLPEGLAEALQRAAGEFLDYLGAARVVLPRGLGREARRAWQLAVR
ncbi:crosslink repair DNA glycosylase YcaQ family protein [Halomonas pacifica]|uniref:DNA glycosylase AlkZ-like family protein n=1 Tax=Bisbaumannia pacifica TaxID=77098 RepID=UPI0023590CE0|nr:crosslink repair DNA glycosylase YcaQ family protein [Halomonas pacifica]MDC8803185.1 crosslink repair DNA glycosylase YcaQ family protein [Halomonas pacifica]